MKMFSHYRGRLSADVCRPHVSYLYPGAAAAADLMSFWPEKQVFMKWPYWAF